MASSLSFVYATIGLFIAVLMFAFILRFDGTCETSGENAEFYTSVEDELSRQPYRTNQGFCSFIQVAKVLAILSLIYAAMMLFMPRPRR